MKNFVDCNSDFRFDGVNDYQISKEEMLKQLNESIESGLVVDQELGVFIKNNYGALVGFCPENCSTINDVLKYTLLDFDRKIVGKPTAKEKIKGLFDSKDSLYDPYFGYQKLVEDGYDLVIGPGCVVYGEHWDKAIYCRNYEEILSRSNSKG